VVRLYGLRNWVEQGSKQVKGELGWADFQVRSDRAIRRHWTLVCCAFLFCWQAVLAEHPTQPAPADLLVAASAARGALPIGHRRRTGRQELLAGGVAGGTGLAYPLARCWQSWSPAPPPRQLQQLLDAVAGGQPLHLYATIVNKLPLKKFASSDDMNYRQAA